MRLRMDLWVRTVAFLIVEGKGITEVVIIGVGFDYRRSDAPKEGFRFRLVQMPCMWAFRNRDRPKLTTTILPTLRKMG